MEGGTCFRRRREKKKETKGVGEGRKKIRNRQVRCNTGKYIKLIN